MLYLGGWCEKVELGMSFALVAEQFLNGLQLGILLFLLSAGLTLIFGIMNFINLAHGSLYMFGGYLGFTATQWTGSFLVGMVLSIAAVAAIGAILERLIFSRFYHRDHLDQVLVTFGMIIVANELAQMVWGPLPVRLAIPEAMRGSVLLIGNFGYPIARLVIIAAGCVVALALYVLIHHTRLGIWIRAGASDRPMASALGVNVNLLFVMVFALGAALAALAGLLASPILAVQVGMGEQVLILALVVIVIGGIGSIRGAFVAALIVGVTDTFGRVLIPPAFASMLIFMVMAGVLIVRPNGLFPANA